MVSFPPACERSLGEPKGAPKAGAADGDRVTSLQTTGGTLGREVNWDDGAHRACQATLDVSSPLRVLRGYELCCLLL